MKLRTPAFLKPGRRVRWHTRAVSGSRVCLQDFPATVIKRGPSDWWHIQVQGEAETRRVSVDELAEDFLIPEPLPEYIPSPWTQNRLPLDGAIPVPEKPEREPEIDWNALDIPF